MNLSIINGNMQQLIMESVENETSIMALFHDGKLLILKRGSTAPWMPNKWSLVGGGVDEGESPSEAIVRETFEETGAIVTELKHVGTIYFIWDENWAKTEKQKKRYKYFKGEEMHLFIGRFKEFKELTKKGEDYWEEPKLMNIQQAIDFINKTRPFSKDMQEYRENQLKFLKFFLKALIKLVKIKR